MAFDLFAKTQTANDTLVSGDSGAGYVNPTQLFEGPARSAYSSLADASQLWIDWNKKVFVLCVCCAYVSDCVCLAVVPSDGNDIYWLCHQWRCRSNDSSGRSALLALFTTRHRKSGDTREDT